jgi:hypothetical protein
MYHIESYPNSFFYDAYYIVDGDVISQTMQSVQLIRKPSTQLNLLPAVQTYYELEDYLFPKELSRLPFECILFRSMRRVYKQHHQFFFKRVVAFHKYCRLSSIIDQPISEFVRLYQRTNSRVDYSGG